MNQSRKKVHFMSFRLAVPDTSNVLYPTRGPPPGTKLVVEQKLEHFARPFQRFQFWYVSRIKSQIQCQKAFVILETATSSKRLGGTNAEGIELLRKHPWSSRQQQQKGKIQTMKFTFNIHTIPKDSTK